MRKKTQEEFEKEVYTQVKDEYSVKSKYININTYVLMKHKICGYEWNVSPANFLKKNSRCPLCFGNIKINSDEFIKKLDDKYNGNIELISEFKGIHNDITVKFIDCGHEHTVKAKNLLYKNNNGCNVCNKNERKTQKQFCEEIYELVGNEYEVLEQYINTHTKILFKHNICNHEYPVTPSDFLSGHRCPKCQHRSYIKTNEEFKQEVFNLVSDEYEFLEEYINNRTDILIRHNNCGTIYSVKPSKFLTGRRCPVCMWKITSEKQMRTHKEFCDIVEELVGDEYTIVSQYKGSHEYIHVKHNICNHEYPVKPNNFIYGRRCPFCAESKGEQEIRKYLSIYGLINITQEDFERLIDKVKYNVNYYIPQKEFDGLIGLKGGLLSYDFYLPRYNLLIEYQGIQHEQYTPGLHKSYDDFLKQQEHDKRKKEYCLNNNIKLLEIWYYDFDNIEKILKEELNKIK